MFLTPISQDLHQRRISIADKPEQIQSSAKRLNIRFPRSGFHFFNIFLRERWGYSPVSRWYTCEDFRLSPDLWICFPLLFSSPGPPWFLPQPSTFARACSQGRVLRCRIIPKIGRASRATDGTNCNHLEILRWNEWNALVQSSRTEPGEHIWCSSGNLRMIL